MTNPRLETQGNFRTTLRGSPFLPTWEASGASAGSRPAQHGEGAIAHPTPGAPGTAAATRGAIPSAHWMGRPTRTATALTSRPEPHSEDESHYKPSLLNASDLQTRNSHTSGAPPVCDFRGWDRALWQRSSEPGALDSLCRRRRQELRAVFYILVTSKRDINDFQEAPPGKRT